MTDLVGQNLGKYRIVAKLGQGGMATVYKAYQTGLERYVALKVLHAHLAQDTDFISRFEREARAVASLRHQNIVQVFDFDVVADYHFMAMELIEGPSLKAELTQRALLKHLFTLDEIGRMMIALCEGMDYAHSQGMVHRDLKPGNLALTTSGQIIILDFGIARIMGDTQYTVTGALIGSPKYMSPEQVQSQRGDERSDIYSLGILMYEMVTGRVPFEADTPAGTMMLHISQMLPLPQKFRPEMPPELESVIVRALSKRPSDRYPSTLAFAQAIRSALQLAPEQTLLRYPVKPIATEDGLLTELPPDDPSFYDKPDETTKPKPSQEPIQCAYCSASNDVGDRFCLRCGKALWVTCRFCYTNNRVDGRNCIQCGARLHMATVQRDVYQSEAERRREAQKALKIREREERLQRLLSDLQDAKKHSMSAYGLQEYGLEALPRLLKLLDHENPVVRYGVVHCLGNLQDERVVPPIVGKLQDPHPGVRYWALRALTGLDAVQTAVHIAPLLEDNHKQVKEQALKTLEAFDTKEAKELIKKNKRGWWPFS